ncbi:MAG: F0F1 ATP synthase subunit B, partial [Acaryochloridaceae cyanobacterium SU_2_1]|nr:F0F1 ATP synthase subunit B [Acaryochloridaceae cyanobacterium SU_2_1]
GRGFLGKALVKRRETIEVAIAEAEANQQLAAKSLAEGQEKLAQAKATAEKILATAQVNASKAKEQILAEAKDEIQRIQHAASQDTTASQERAIADLRQRVTTLALAKVETDLVAQLSNNDKAQRQLIDRSIALLGGNS